MLPGDQHRRPADGGLLPRQGGSGIGLTPTRSVTVLGAGGFIGSNLVGWLESHSIPCFAPPRGVDLSATPLGDVIYCIGLTADFRSRPFETVEAHVCYLKLLLTSCQFDSFTYLSSTRLYQSLAGVADEGRDLAVNPLDRDHLYNLSKATGEALLLASGARARVVRLSNVYGFDPHSANFLPTLVRSCVAERRLVLATSLDSEKDYVSISDVVALLPRIALEGQATVYNLASGENVSNRSIVEALSALTGCQVDVRPGAPTQRFPSIDVQRLRDEFGYQPRRMLDDLPPLVEAYRAS